MIGWSMMLSQFAVKLQCDEVNMQMKWVYKQRQNKNKQNYAKSSSCIIERIVCKQKILQSQFV